MRVLVIGGTGLISTAAVNAMLRRGHDVITLNRGVSESRIEGRVHRLVGDRHDLPWFKQAVASVKPEAILDAIAFTPEEVQQTLEAIPNHTAHFLFISTVCVYGPLANIPADEDEPHKPVSQYGRDKSACDRIVLNYGERTGQPVTVLRPSHCYGPGQPFLSLWGYDRRLLHRLKTGRPMVVPGDGVALWQPGFVLDLAEAICEALGNPSVYGCAIHLVGHEIMTWRDYFSRMARALGYDAKIVCCPSELINRIVPESSEMLMAIFRHHAAYSDKRLRTLLPGYTQRTEWEDGVRQTAAWIELSGAVDERALDAEDDRIAKVMEKVLKCGD